MGGSGWRAKRRRLVAHVASDCPSSKPVAIRREVARRLSTTLMSTFRSSDAMSSATRGRWSRCERRSTVGSGGPRWRRGRWPTEPRSAMEARASTPAAPRKFVVRFMSARGSFWDATHWSEHALAVAFEKRFAQKVDVRRKQRADGSWQFVIRPRLAPSPRSYAPRSGFLARVRHG